MNRHNILKLIIIPFLISLVTYSASSAHDFNTKLYNTQTGLSDNSVRSMRQDSKGFIWFGTLNGLTRYDGYNMTHIPIRDFGGNLLYEPKIRHLHEDTHGNLWVVSSNDGISCINLSNFQFREFLPESEGMYFRYLYESPDKNIWLYGEKGALLVKITDDNQFESISLTKGNGLLPSDQVYQIFGDNHGNVFLSTEKGIVKYSNGETKVIDPFRHVQWFSSYNLNTLAVAMNGEIISINGDGKVTKEGTLPGVNKRLDLPGEFMIEGKWFISTPKGIYSFDAKKAKITENENLRIPNAKVIRDNHNNIWLHNETGKVWYLDSVNLVSTQFSIIPADKVKLIDMERYSIIQLTNGESIITTKSEGFYIIDKDKKTITYHSMKDLPASVVPSDNILSVMQDNSGAVWIGTEDIGVAKITKFKHIVTDLSKELKNNLAVRMVKQLTNGNINISYYDGSLDTYDKSLNLISSRQFPKVIYDMIEDDSGNLWYATRGGKGVYIEDMNGNIQDIEQYTSSYENVFALLKDTKGRIWSGTFGGGLDVTIPQQNRNGYDKRNFLNDTYGHQRIRHIYEDSEHKIWVGTNEGVVTFDPDSLINGLSLPKSYNVANNSLNNNDVSCIIEDVRGRIWIGQEGGGISIFDHNGNKLKITNIGKENGLPNSNVQTLIKEDNRYIWTFTYLGAARINVETLNVESFVFKPNSLGNVYRPNSAVLLPDGKMVLGSSEGAYVVDINNLTPSEKPTTPKLTSMRINGDLMSDGHIKNDLWEQISQDGKIALNHNENSLDLSFSTFNYDAEVPDKFRYRLDPSDKNWSDFSDDNHVSFRNLTPGIYRLHVQAQNTSGEWSEVKELTIKIKSPVWETWWAKTIYILLILAAVALFVYAIDRIRTLHGRVKQEKELTDFKLEFYTNISHEFRTPLTLIQASLEKSADCIADLKTDHPEVHVSPLRSSLATLDKNCKRMLRLIEELLTFRKLERNKMALFYEHTEIVSFVKELFNNFIDEAHSKDIKFKFHSNEHDYYMNIDRNALDKIVTNLISNAIKYTYEKGKVDVILDINKSIGQLIIQVKDNGIGIPSDKKALLFSRFSQTGMSRSSIGVGLHLTYGLVKLHEGELAHTDNGGGGSIFSVMLPLNLQESVEKVDDKLGRPKFSSFEDLTEGVASLEENKMPENTADDKVTEKRKRTLLVIDDDSEIRKLLHDEFSTSFNVLTASNGHTGLDMARQNDVNLVICDVMMPDISGYKVTRMLKEDFATSHIPVIQLTALNNDDSQYEGMECGADAYITKPFKLKYLKMVAAKILERYEGVISKFSANPSLPKPQIPLNNRDSEFAEKLAGIVIKNIDKAEFTVDDFSSQMALGRTVFFKKVKGVTGYSPKEYIRVMRMKHAAELLLTTDNTITEIAFMVGISDPSYFNKCFKAQFGKAPSVYKKENVRTNYE